MERHELVSSKGEVTAYLGPGLKDTVTENMRSTEVRSKLVLVPVPIRQSTKPEKVAGIVPS